MAKINKGWQAEDRYLYLKENMPLKQIIINVGVKHVDGSFKSVAEMYPNYPEVHDFEQRIAALLNITKYIPTAELADRVHDRGEIEHLTFHEKAADRIIHGQTFVITRGGKSYLAQVIDSEQAEQDEGLVDTTVVMSNSEIPDAPSFIERDGVVIPHMQSLA